MKANYYSFSRAMFILFVIIGLLKADLAKSQEWYDTEWQYRREIAVDSPGAIVLTDFQVEVTLNSSFDFSNANPDGSDIRITDNSGITLISFWIEDWNAAAMLATIWIKIPSIPLGGTSIYLYYGNPIATNLSDGNNTFEFFDDFEAGGDPEPGYYSFGPASTIMVEDQVWETSAPHTLSVVDAPTGADYTYYGYYGLQTNGGIGMAGSNDLINWTKFPETGPLPNNPLFHLDGERWASVLLDGSTYYMVHTRDYSSTSNIVYRESTDGLSWTAPTQVIPPISNDRNQNPSLFHDPNDNQYYLYWFRRTGTLRKIMVRSSATVAGLATAPDIELISSPETVAAPNMLFYDGVYFLSTEIYESEWKVRIYSGDSPTGPFSVLPGNPVLDDGCACLFQTYISNMIYEYYCKETSGTWTLDMRVVDPSTGRIMYENGEIDDNKWTPDGGGTWDAKQDTQQDGTEGIIAEGNITANNSILKSSFSGSDFILEGYGRQIADRMWGFGFRTTNAQNTYALNIYEDLDLTNNLYLYRFTSGGNATVWNTGLGAIDYNTWYKLTVKAYGNNFEVYVDDDLKTTTPVSDNSLASGSIALYGEDGTVAQFNDVRVRKYTSTEPTTVIGDEENQSSLIDMAIYNTTCGDFEVRVKPNTDIVDNYLTNIQFTIKWPEGTVNLTDISSSIGVALQGSVVVDNDTNYAVFAAATSMLINWDANTEYTVLSFSHDQSTTGYADFEIDTLAWAGSNNGDYYVELLGLDYTGIVYGNASNVYLGKCGEISALLQAPYEGSGLMNKGLAGNIPLDQPYDVAPWDYMGTESLTTMDTSAVDWVLVELRSDTNNTVEKKAALLLKDGNIVQYNNTTQGVHFDNTVEGSSYFIVVHHRNHMPIMTGASRTFDGTLVDFTDETICYGTPNAEIELETGIYGMIAGDINSNGYLSYSGPGNDRGLILARIVSELSTTDVNDTVIGYFDEDVMMDYQVKYIGGNNDRSILLTNLASLTGTVYLNAVYFSEVPGVTTKSESINDGPIHIFLNETIDALQVSITSDEVINDGIFDNVQFTLSWETSSNELITTILQNAQSSYGLNPQGDAIESGDKMYQTFVSVVPMELPNPMEKNDEVVLVSFTKYKKVNIGKSLNIADNAFTENHNGDYYVSLLGDNFTGSIKSTPLGLSNLANPGLYIYPNPVTSGIVNVDMKLDKAQDVTILVLDIQGKIVHSQTLQGNKGSSKNCIELHKLTKGIYYIKVQADNLAATRKLILL